jgi:hypothetical protein
MIIYDRTRTHKSDLFMNIAGNVWEMMMIFKIHIQIGQPSYFISQNDKQTGARIFSSQLAHIFGERLKA